MLLAALLVKLLLQRFLVLQQEHICGKIGCLVVKAMHLLSGASGLLLTMQVLVTGSLYLVGDVLKHLKKFI